MRNKVDQKIVKTQMQVMSVERELYRAFNRAGVESIQPIPSSNASASFEISGMTAPLSPLIYKVQIFVWDYGYEREVEFNAIGSGSAEYFATSLAREYGVCMDFGKSKKKRDQIIDLFTGRR